MGTAFRPLAFAFYCFFFLVDDALEERLVQSLDRCQYIGQIQEFLGERDINISSLPPYVLKEGSKMVDEVRRHTVGEASSNYMASMLNRSQPVPLGQESFHDLRQSFMHLGKNWDEGRSLFIFQDEKQTSAIALRVRMLIKQGFTIF